MLITKSKDTGDIIVTIDGSGSGLKDDDCDDIVKDIVDNCYYADVTIRVKKESQEYLKSAFWNAAHMKVLKRDIEKSKLLMYEIQELEMITKKEDEDDESV